MLRVRPHPEALVKRWHVDKVNVGAVTRAVLTTDAMIHAWEGMFSGRSRRVSRFMQLAYQANPRDRWAGFAVADAMADQLRQAKSREKQAWQRILAIRPDHVMALRMLWRIATKEGDNKEAAKLFQRLRRLVPFDPEVLATVHQASHDEG